MIDTADAYQTEELVGRAIRGRRDDVLIATKFGLVWHEEVAGGFEVRADAAYVHEACDASLRRLGVDVIDLFYLHHRSESTPIEETVGAMSDLVDRGKIRALGLSNVTADDLRRANAVHPIAALQEQWSLTQRGIEHELLPTVADLGIVVVAHSPTGNGLLHREHERVGDRVPPELGARVHEVATERGVTTGQVALAWVHHRQEVHDVPVVPLPGTTRTSHLRANLAAAELVLSDDELRQLDAASTAE